MAAVSLGSAQAYFLTLSLKQKYFVFNKVEINLKFIEDKGQHRQAEKDGGKNWMRFSWQLPKVFFTRRATKSRSREFNDPEPSTGYNGYKLKKSFVINFSVPSITILISGRTKRPMKRLLARMASIYKKQSYQPTGKHPSPRSASVCRLVNNSGSSSSTRQPNLCIHWSLTGNTAPLRWVVTRGRRLSVRKPPCRKTATWKGSMLKRVTPKQESASLLTRKIIASLAIPESGLVQEEIIRAEM